MNMESHGGMILTGERQRNERKTCPIAILSTTNLTWTDLGLCGERLMTNHLSLRALVRNHRLHGEYWKIQMKIVFPTLASLGLYYSTGTCRRF
jgi:hypothetical protein